MKRQEQWIQWSPRWAPHVKGKYNPRTRDEETGMCEPQRVHMLCAFKHPDGTVCGATWQTICASGNVRSHINTFAKQHGHKDFTRPGLIVRPDSKRASILEKKNVSR